MRLRLILRGFDRRTTDDDTFTANKRRAREICTGDRWDELTGAVVEHRTDPWTAADAMLGGVLG